MPAEPPAPSLDLLLTGHYRQGAGYSALRPGGTRDDLLIYTVAGAGRFGHAGGQHLAQAGDAVLLRAGTPHDYATLYDHWELLWVHFWPRTHWPAWTRWTAFAPGALHTRPTHPERVQAALLETHRLATGGGPHRQDWAMHALERALLDCRPPGAEAGLDDRVARAVRHLRAHLDRPLALPELAAQGHLSCSRFAHLFRAQVGLSPGAFLERERLARAAQLLTRTAQAVSGVAREVGYEDPLYFSRRFKARYGLSPRQHRQAALEPHQDIDSGNARRTGPGE